MHEERFDLLIEEPEQERRGVPYSVVFSVAVHAALIFWIATHVTRVAPETVPTPIVHYVELMRQNPVDKTFTEAPGEKIKSAPRQDAPWSDANRKAASMQSTGEQPTLRPGDGTNQPFQQPSQPRGERQQQRAQQTAQEAFQQPQRGAEPQQPFAQPQQPSNATSQTMFRASAGAVDLRGAIREIGKAATSGGDGMDVSRAVGGEKGHADTGQLSFETQWYDWGEYAQSMVSRIRVNWYSIMPDLIRTGVKGVVTIRFTIERDGRISDIEILKSSDVPPFDFAAKHALELASPLKPLPADFPKKSERVTAMFYYNMEIPNG